MRLNFIPRYSYRRFIIYTFLFIFSFPAFAWSLESVPATEDSTLKEQKAKEGYILDLRKLIEKSKQKIKVVDQKIQEQAKQRRNEEREEKAREYYTKAMQLFQEGKLKEAQALWQKAIEITEHPEMKGYLSESARRTKKQQKALQEAEERQLKDLEVERGYSAEEVNQKYDEAVKLFKEKKYVEAKDAFEKVDEMFPDHKATRSYMMLIDQKVQEDQQQLIQKALKEQAAQEAKEKEAWRQELTRREKQKQQQLEDQAEGVYQEALRLYKIREFEQAKEKFKEVEWVLPDYKDTPKYLARIDRDIELDKGKSVEEKAFLLKKQQEDEQAHKSEEQERLLQQKQKEETEHAQRLEDEADFLYRAAVSLYNKKLYSQAKEKFDEVQNLYPNYQSTKSYLQKVEKNLLDEEKQKAKDKKQQLQEGQRSPATRNAENEALKVRQRQQEDKQFKKETEILYKSAIEFYRKSLFVPAKEKFEEVESRVSNYKDTEAYLARIDKNLPNAEKKQAQLAKDHQLNLEQKAQTVKVSESPEIQSDVVKKAEEERRQRFSNEAEAKYKEAMAFYKGKNFREAKLKFIQVEALYPGYKDTQNYLNRIDDDIDKESKTKSPATRNLKENKVNKAVSKEMQPSASEGKGTCADMISVSDCMKLLGYKADRVFKQAVTLYKERKYIRAKEIFLEVQKLDPKYPGLEKYLARTEQKIKEQLGEEKSKQQKNENADQAAQDQLRKKRESFVEEGKQFDWQKERDARIAVLKAKEQQLDEMKGEQYKEFRKKLDEEYKELKIADQERQRGAQQRAKDLKRRMQQEETAKRREEERLNRLEAQKQKELEDKQKQEELAKEKNKELEAKLEQQKQKEFDQKEKQEDIKKQAQAAAQQEEDVKIKEIEELKRKELEHKKQAQALTDLIADEQNKLNERIALRFKQLESEYMTEGKIQEEREKLEEQQKQLHAEQEQVKQDQQKLQSEKETIEKDLNVIKQVVEKPQSMDAVEYQKLKDEVLKEQEVTEYRTKIQAQQESEEKQRQEVRRYQKQIESILVNKDSAERKKWKGGVEELYLEAEEAYRYKRYKEAKAKFSMVEGMYPGYRLARVYVRKLETYLEGQDAKQEKLIQRKHTELEQQKEKEQQKQKQEETKKAQDELKALQEEVDAESAKYLDLYKADKMPEAEEQFKKVEELLTHEGLTQDFIKGTHQKIDIQKAKLDKDREGNRQRQKQEEAKKSQNELKTLQQQIDTESAKYFDLYKTDQMPQADEQFNKVEQLLVHPGLTEDFVKNVHQKIDTQKAKLDKEREKAHQRKQHEEELAKKKADQEKEQAFQKVKKQIDSLYAESLNLYEQGKEDLSQKKFQEVEELLRHNEIPEDYAKNFRERINTDREGLDKKRIERQKQLAEEKDKEMKKQKEREALALKKDLDKLYNDSVKLYKSDQRLLAQGKLSDYEKMIDNPALTPSDHEDMLKRLNSMREKIKKDEEQERIEQDRLAHLEEEKSNREKERVELENKKELELLQRKVALGEEQLERERKKEEVRKKEDEDRLEAEKSKEEEKKQQEQAHLEKMRQEEEGQKKDTLAQLEEQAPELNEAVKEKGGVTHKKLEVKEKKSTPETTIREQLAAEREKRKQLEELLKERKNQIKEERKQIQQEFAEHLEQLYTQAVHFYEAGSNQQAANLFGEIDKINPGYKKTQAYRVKVNKLLVASADSQPTALPAKLQPQEQSKVTAQDKVHQAAVTSALNELEEGL